MNKTLLLAGFFMIAFFGLVCGGCYLLYIFGG